MILSDLYYKDSNTILQLIKLTHCSCFNIIIITNLIKNNSTLKQFQIKQTTHRLRII